MLNLRVAITTLTLIVLAGASLIVSPGQAAAGDVPGDGGFKCCARILLQGTDAWENHGDGPTPGLPGSVEAGPLGPAGSYGHQVAAALGGNIALINDFGVIGPTTYMGVPVTGFASVPAAGPLTDFTGVEFSSPGKCCSDPATDPSLGIAATEAEISAYLAAGGNIGIEDFSGNLTWTSILGFDPAPGIVTGVGGTACSDPGMSTAAGFAAGFVGSAAPGVYIDSCFIHQAYDKAFFAAHGFTSLIDGGPGSGFVGDSIVLGFDPGVVPEPAAWSMMLIGFCAIGIVARRRKGATSSVA